MCTSWSMTRGSFIFDSECEHDARHDPDAPSWSCRPFSPRRSSRGSALATKLATPLPPLSILMFPYFELRALATRCLATTLAMPLPPLSIFLFPYFELIGIRA